MPNEQLFCRLCAQPKTMEKLTQASEEYTEETLSKLKLLNLKFLNLEDPDIPKTVCIPCSCNVDRYLKFIQTIEAAQNILVGIFKSQTVEVEDRGDNNKEFKVDYFQTKVEKLSDNGDEVSIDFELRVSSSDEDINEEKDTVVKSEDNDFKYEKNHPNIKNENKASEDEDTMPLASIKSAKDTIKSNQLIISKKKMKGIKKVSDKSIANKKQLNWRNFNWLCAFCETQFDTYEEHLTHLIAEHNTCAVFKCPHCNSRHYILRRFINHVSKHYDEKRYTCIDCLETFSVKKRYENHIKSHSKNPCHVCLGCNTKFYKKSELQDHIKYNRYNQFLLKSAVVTKYKSKIVPNKFNCNICDKTFKGYNALYFHKKLHTTKEHICEICGKEFFLKCHLDNHIILFHTDTKPHLCPVCNSAFKTANHLKRHSQSHETARPYTCDICGKNFRQKRHLSQHINIHSDNFPHVCTYCNKGFRIKHKLDDHLSIHTGNHKYKCELCEGKSFSNWPNYNLHMKKSHNISMAKKKLNDQGLYEPVEPVNLENL